MWGRPDGVGPWLVRTRPRKTPRTTLRGGSKRDLAVGSVTSESSPKDFAQAKVDYVLAEMRVASLRLRLLLNEIDAAGLALNGP